MPSPQQLAITMLGNHLSPRETRAVWSGGLVRLLGELGFTPGAARIALTRLVNNDLLARTREGRQVHYTLTARALAVLADGDRRIFTLGTAEDGGEWTVLWHSIPDDRRRERERLLRRLRFLGFGSVQDGTWIAPHDREQEVAGLLRELGVDQHAWVMLGRPGGSLDVRAFLGRVWDLDALDERYAAFVAEFEPYASADVRGGQDRRAAFALHTRLTHTFREFPFLDPEIPPELVPAPRRRQRAVRLFHDLHDALAPAAQRHFDEETGMSRP